MHQNSKRLFEFGAFRLDPLERLLLRGSDLVPLTPKAFELLLALVERHGHLVEKSQLMKLVWPDSFVEETNLSHHISILRSILGEKTKADLFIETVPRRGYRFVAPVREEQASLSQREDTRDHAGPGYLPGFHPQYEQPPAVQTEPSSCLEATESKKSKRRWIAWAAAGIFFLAVGSAALQAGNRVSRRTESSSRMLGRANAPVVTFSSCPRVVAGASPLAGPIPVLRNVRREDRM
jgi:DNA-binding winged helix-turn-helix (wHTH) protein